MKGQGKNPAWAEIRKSRAIGTGKIFWTDYGETLVNCLAYIDLNPVRAGMVKKPEKYRWCSLGYHVQTNNKEGFLSLDLAHSKTTPNKFLGAIDR
jgi:hypothetical protein